MLASLVQLSGVSITVVLCIYRQQHSLIKISGDLEVKNGVDLPALLRNSSKAKILGGELPQLTFWNIYGHNWRRILSDTCLNLWGGFNFLVTFWRANLAGTVSLIVCVRHKK